VKIERLLRVRTPDPCIRPQVWPGRSLDAVFPNSRVRPWRERRNRDHLGALRRVAEEPGLVNSRLRTGRSGPGQFLLRGSAPLQGFQSRRDSLHQRMRIETRPQRGRVEPPSAAEATPLVLLVPGLAMDALHIA